MKRFFNSKLFFVLFPVILFLVFLLIVNLSSSQPESVPVAPIGLSEQKTFEEEFSETKTIVENDHPVQDPNYSSSLSKLPELSISFSAGEYADIAEKIETKSKQMDQNIADSISAGEDAMSQTEFPAEDELEIPELESLPEFQLPELKMDTCMPSLPEFITK